MKKLIIKNSSVALIAQMVAVVCGFVLPRLIMEQYGSEVNGLTQSIKQFIGVIGFMDLGVGQVVRSALYTPLSEKNYKHLSSVMVSGEKFYRKIATALLGYSLILMCIYPLLADQNFGWLYTATLIAAMSISSFAQYYFGIIDEQLLSADQRGYIISYLQIVCNLLNVAVCIWMLRVGSSIQMVKLAASMVFLIRPFVIRIYISKNYTIDRRIRYNEEPVTQKWDGVAQHVSAVVLDGTDTIVLTLLSTLNNVSIYSVYYMVVSSIQYLYQSATAGIQSAAGMLWAQKDPNAINRMFYRVEMLLHYVIVFIFGCTSLLIVPFVEVYTHGLNDADYIQPLFAVLLVTAYGIRCLRTPYNIWILAAGHYKQTQSCHTTAAAINLVLSIISVSAWGLVGVAIGTLIAMIYQTLWMAVYCSRCLMGQEVKERLKQFAVDAVTTFAIVLVGSRIDLAQVSYLGWFVMAIKVALIAIGIVVISAITLICSSSMYKSKISS